MVVRQSVYLLNTLFMSPDCCCISYSLLHPRMDLLGGAIFLSAQCKKPGNSDCARLVSVGDEGLQQYRSHIGDIPTQINKRYRVAGENMLSSLCRFAHFAVCVAENQSVLYWRDCNGLLYRVSLLYNSVDWRSGNRGSAYGLYYSTRCPGTILRPQATELLAGNSLWLISTCLLFLITLCLQCWFWGHLFFAVWLL